MRAATRALVAGRLNACERHNTDASELAGAACDAGGVHACTVQLAMLRREQGRPAEAQLAVRDLPPGAVLASILVDLGRDSDAWVELNAWGEAQDSRTDGDDDWLADAALFGEVAAVLGDRPVARSLYSQLLPHRDRFAMDRIGATCHGSVSRQLGLLAHRLDDWEEARGHYEDALVAHAEAAAPVLLAHTRRQYAALLRVRGGPGDWDRAVDLLAGAEDTYRRLGIERLARDCQAVLARSDLTDAASMPGVRRAVNVFRRDGERGWLMRYGDVEAWVRDGRGLQDLAQLLARPVQSLHVADLLADPVPSVPGVGTAATVGVAAPWRVGGPARLRSAHAFDELARAEHRTRLDELTAESKDANEPIDVALVDAERDLVEGLLAREGDSLELAREAVATRIRLGIDSVERVHPELGRHLRRSVRTGTFCSYEPPARTTWET